MNTTNYRLRAAALFFAAGIPAWAQYTGQINGLVLGPDGKAAHAAKVYATLTSPPPLKMNHTLTPRVIASRVVTNGAFTISNMPPGDYRVCADFQEQSFVNTCRWGEGPIVRVANGTSAAAPAIRFTKGTKLHVRIADPGGALQANGGKGLPLLVGLQMRDGIVAIPMVGSDTAGRDHEMLVPFDTDLRLHISSKAYNLASAPGAVASLAGSAASGVSTMPVRIPSGSTPTSVTINIAGLSGLK